MQINLTLQLTNCTQIVILDNLTIFVLTDLSIYMKPKLVIVQFTQRQSQYI